MDSFSSAFCAMLSILALIGTPAAASQIVSLDYGPLFPDGSFYVSGTYDWPPEGAQALAKVEYSGAELLGATFTGYGEIRATWWDDVLGDVTGNEYLFAFDCDLANGCVRIVSPSLAYAWLSTPRGFDQSCSHTTVGNCSYHYEPAYGDFFGIFRPATSSGPFDLRVMIGDVSAIPEPATWMATILGLAFVGVMLRRRLNDLRSPPSPASGGALTQRKCRREVSAISTPA